MEDPLTVETYLSVIRTAYPQLEVLSAQRVEGLGQFSDVFIVNDALIFRFPRNEHVAAEMRREVELLRGLQGRLSLPIPDPTYLKLDSDGLLILMGYPMLAGLPVLHDTLDDTDDTTLRRFARQLATFLRELHAIPPDSFGVSLSIEGRRDEWANTYTQFRDKLYPYMRPDARLQVSATFDAALADLRLWEFDPVIRHGDFGTRNILYDPITMSVSGVIDFSFCGYGDPAQDVGAVWTLGEPFMEHFFEFYPEMRATIPRVQFIRSTYALLQAMYALRDGDQDAFEDGIQNYR